MAQNTKEAQLPILVRSLNIVSVLYILSLATSMGGMELFASLLLVLLLLIFFIQNPPKEKYLSPPFIRPVLVFAVIVLVGIWINDSTLDQKFYDTGRLRFFLLYAVLFYTLRYFSNDFRWLRPLFVITCFIGVYGFCQHFVPLDLFRPEGKKVFMYALPNEKIGPLVVGTFNHHLTFANIYLFYASLFTTIGLYHIPRNKWPLLLGGLLFVLCIWTQSRAAWVAVPVTLLIVLAEKGWKVVVGALLLVVLGLGIAYHTDAGFQGRFQKTFLEKNDFYNIGPRKRLWVAQWHIFKDHPIFGIGYNNNERQSKAYMDKLFPDVKEKFYGHAHSTPLQILATTGILGTLSFLWLWWVIFRQTYVHCRRFPRGSLERAVSLALLAGFAGFLIQGLTQWNFGDAEVLHNLMFFWAVIASLKFSPCRSM